MLIFTFYAFASTLQGIDKHHFLGPLILIASGNSQAECQVVSMRWNKICPNLPNIPVGAINTGALFGL